MTKGYWIGWTIASIFLLILLWPIGILVAIISLVAYPKSQKGKPTKKEIEIENAALKERLRTYEQGRE